MKLTETTKKITKYVGKNSIKELKYYTRKYSFNEKESSQGRIMEQQRHDTYRKQKAK